MKQLLAIVLLTPLWAAAPGVPIAELIDVVREGIRTNEPDASLAKSLHKLKLSERLDWRVIEELESEGAGPKAVEELMQLRDLSMRSKPPAEPPRFDEPPAPSMDELRRVVTEARAVALDYAKSLPNFICIQTMQRFESRTGIWRLGDTLDIRLTYFGQKENYKLLKVNGRDTWASYNSVGGALSEGEFGSLLRLVFEPESRAEFRWDRWTRIRKRSAYVLSFSIRKENSKFRLDFQRARNTARFSTVPAQRGFVWIDRETNRILRIYSEGYQIPSGFPLRASSSMVDYAFLAVGSQEFLLPLRADVRIESRELATRNVVDFHDYQKFSADTSISFDH